MVDRSSTLGCQWRWRRLWRRRNGGGMGMGGVVAACLCRARVPFIEGERERGGGGGGEVRARSQRARACRQWRTRCIGEWVAARCDARGHGAVDVGGRSLVLVAVLGPCGQLSRAFGASLPCNCEGDRRSEERDDEAGNGNICITTSHRTSMPSPCYWR